MRTCTEKQRGTCQVEKLGCKGCYYYKGDDCNARKSNTNGQETDRKMGNYGSWVK